MRRCSRTYASRWNELFTAQEPQSQMTWKGYFSDISAQSPQTMFYNYYSEEDEVFELSANIEDGILPTAYRGILN